MIDCYLPVHLIITRNLFMLPDTHFNLSKDIVIGDHVWIGNQVIITKGAKISNNVVVGTGSIVTGKSFPSSTIIAGMPAKVIHNNINWLRERI